MRSRTVFITVFHSFISKNILNTEILKLLANDASLKIVLLVPEIKKDFFTKTYQSNNVFVEAVPNERLILSPKFRFFSRVSHLMIESNYVTYKRHERLDANRGIRGYIKFFAESLLNILLSKLVFTHLTLRKNILSISLPEVNRLFDKYKPEVLFSTDAFDESDCLFQIEAKNRNIKLVSMVRSWDNCYSKGLMRVVPDRLIVNNKTIKEEAVTIHGVSEEGVLILGSPQYDVFINNKRKSREDFFKSMGFDINKKLVVFAPAGKILSSTDDQIIEILKRAVDSKLIRHPVQFLIRNHPNHPADISSVAGRGDFIIEDPGKTFNRNNPKDTELTLDDNEHLANELYHADIVIWVATTLGMDSIVFDRPQISINFDGFEERPYFKSVRRYHDEDHMKKMLAKGGVTVANSPTELIDSINKYLDNHKWNQTGRDMVRDQQFYKLDGLSGSRIAQAILSELSNG